MATVFSTQIDSVTIEDTKPTYIAGSDFVYSYPLRQTIVSGTTKISGDAYSTLGTNLQQFLYVPMNAVTKYAVEQTVGTIASTEQLKGYITDYTVEQNFIDNTYTIGWKIVDNNAAKYTASTVYNNIILGTNYTNDDITYTIDDTWAGIVCGSSPEEFKKAQIKAKLKNNLLIRVKSRVDVLLKDLPQNEQVAIETLREEISESEFRKYMKYGFILVPAKSGKIYQIFRNRSHTKVWKGGKLIEEVCVRIKNANVPPTDNVIAFKNMIQIDEEEFRKMSNLFKMAA